jgi:glycosyltransferase involved in cell wall biosynthesis
MNKLGSPEVVGYLEGIGADGRIVGWAVNPLQPDEAAEVSIYVNDRPCAVLQADEFRGDLDGEGIRDGRAGFSIRLDEILGLGGLSSSLEIRAYLDPERKLELSNSPLRLLLRRANQPEENPADSGSRAPEPADGARSIDCYFEGINNKGEIYGWAYDRNDPDFIPKAYLFVEDFPIGVCNAGQYRGDLKAAGIKNGEAGFAFVLPGRLLAKLRPGTRIHAFLDAKATQEFSNSPFVLSEELYENLLAASGMARLKRLVGNFEGIKATGELCGWGRDPFDAAHKPTIYFFYEGKPLGSVEAAEYRGDLKEAGLGDGKCAFVWRNLAFESLRALKAGKAIHAFFDPSQQGELNDSPAQLTKDALKKLWKSVLDPERDDIGIQDKAKLVAELLAYDGEKAEDYKTSNEAAYAYALAFCLEFFKSGEYDLLVRLLSPDVFALRKTRGLRTFELALYRIFALMGLGQLSLEDLEAFDGAAYMEMEEVPKRKPKWKEEKDDKDSKDQKDGSSEADADEEPDEEENEDMDALSDKSGLIELKLSTGKSGERRRNKGESSRKLYDHCIRDACIENFNQFFARFYEDSEESLNRELIFNRYARVMARCLGSIYGDNHLALNFVGVLSRDAHLARDVEFYGLAGKVNQTLGYNYEALQYYLQAARGGSESWRVHHEAGMLYSLICQERIDLYRLKHPEIVRLLADGIRLHPQQSAGYKVAESFFRDFSQLSLGYTKELAGLGDVEKALEQRYRDLNAIAESVVGFQRLGAEICGEIPPRAAHGRNFGTIVFVASQALWQCFYYRAKQKLDHARTLGWDTRYVDFNELPRQQWKKELMYADLIYLCRVPATFEVLDLIAYARSLELPIVYDIDDLIFDEAHFPSPIESYAGTIDEDLHLHLKMDNPLFGVALRQADLVTCSTEPLAEQIRKAVAPETEVVVYPNLLSEELNVQAMHHQRRREGGKQVSPSAAEEKTVEIFYGSATKAHKQVFYEELCPALAVVMITHPEVRLTLIGYFVLPSELQGLADRIKVLEPTPNYMGYIARLRQSDISLAILEQDTFTDCKSELKWFEAAAFGIPSVVTPTATYRHVLEPEQNALFAAGTEEWIRQLNRLIESASLRETIGQNAYQYALNAYKPAVGAEILKGVLGTARKPHPVARAKPRLLFVNVYFAPQSVGGATRIIESHIRYLMEHYGDEYELHVLTTEHDPRHWQRYSVEQYRYGAALVTKIRAPVRNWADYSDEKIHEFCLEYYRNYRFDLIHFHSIQVLTASAVDAARELKIPYVITLHDGWWLSKYLFLIDDEGELVDPADPFSASDPEKDDLLWLLERRNRLYRCLTDAVAVLAVSDKFRQLHEDAGVPARLLTNENGLEPFEVLPRVPAVLEAAPQTSEKSGKRTSRRKTPAAAPAARVRVAHIGGVSRHKGFHLFKEAVTQGDFKNIEAIVIDHGLEPGETYHDRWGSTPVTFRAKFKQSEVNRLYSGIDVLVAPSIWPESFGLVTREALYAGVWVIASNRGAIGDAIENDVNGYVIGVEDVESLKKALENVDKDPKRFVTQLHSLPQRMVSAQIEECVEIYREILSRRNASYSESRTSMV